jgi:hypothetical protein
MRKIIPIIIAAAAFGTASMAAAPYVPKVTLTAAGNPVIGP